MKNLKLKAWENFYNFQRPHASLAIIGVVVSAFLFSFFLYFLTLVFSIETSLLLPSIIILGAALAATDPTAIIPTLRMLRFKRGFLKEIAISESALNDISGSIFTRFLLIALISTPLSQKSAVFDFYLPLLRKQLTTPLLFRLFPASWLDTQVIAY